MANLTGPRAHLLAGHNRRPHRLRRPPLPPSRPRIPHRPPHNMLSTAHCLLDWVPAEHHITQFDHYADDENAIFIARQKSLPDDSFKALLG
eukprot:168636-Rhodomonas_salina.4